MLWIIPSLWMANALHLVLIRPKIIENQNLFTARQL